MGEIVENIIIITAVTVFTPLIMWLSYFLANKARNREERKLPPQSGGEVRATVIKGIRIFALVTGIVLFLAFVGSAAAILFTGEPFYAAIIFFVFGAVTLAGFTVMYALCKNRCAIADDEKVTVIHGLNKKKNKVCYYKDIAFFATGAGTNGGLTGYDKHGIPLFTVPSIFVGYGKFVEKMRQFVSEETILAVGQPKNGIVEPAEYLTQEMKQAPVYKEYVRGKKLSLYMALVWIMCGCCLIFSLSGLFTIMPEFDDIPVTGVLDSYNVKDDSLSFTLENDKNEYYIGSLSYSVIDGGVVNALRDGGDVSLVVWKTDDDGRLNVSRLEINGVVYLDEERVYEKYRENSNTGIIIACVLSSVGLAFAVAGALLSVKYSSVVKRCEKLRSEPSDDTGGQTVA